MVRLSTIILAVTALATAHTAEGKKVIQQAERKKITLRKHGGQHKAAAAAEWGYVHPEKWSGSYINCKGTMQSPINIKTDEVEWDTGANGTLMDVADYNPIYGGEIHNNGHSCQLDREFGSLRLPDGEYKVKQIHFHFPSEHAVNSMLATGELHIVHKHVETGALAVIGILLQDTSHMAADVNTSARRKDVTFLRKLGFETGLPDVDEKMHVNETIDLNAFDRELSGPFFHYKGSLTTPPCSENVHWYILERAAGVTPEMVKKFEAALKNAPNNRPVQPLNDREMVPAIAVDDEFTGAGMG